MSKRIISKTDQAIVALKVTTETSIENRIPVRYQAMMAVVTPTAHRIVTQITTAQLLDGTIITIDIRETVNEELSADELFAIQVQTATDAQRAAELAAGIGQEQVNTAMGVVHSEEQQ